VSAIYYSATRDAKSGIIYLKIVNVDGKPQRVSVQFNGATTINSKAEAVVLTASSPSDTNLINDPNKLVPHTEKVSGLSANFTREFPPYSITVLKLKTK
jgi:alpha-N-arabinofuranosidase